MPTIRAPKSLSTGEEVLFLTSRDRLLNAYLKWYNASRPGDPMNLADAAEYSRTLLRYLVVPTDLQIARYRKEQFFND